MTRFGDNEAPRGRTFRSGDIAAVAGAFIVVLTGLLMIPVIAPPSDLPDEWKKGLLVFGTFFALVYAAMIRGVLIRVRIDNRGITVHNFLRNHMVRWDEFERIESPSEGGNASARVVTSYGSEIRITAIQAKNFNWTSGREDKGSSQLVSEMRKVAETFRSLDESSSGPPHGPTGTTNFG